MSYQNGHCPFVSAYPYLQSSAPTQEDVQCPRCSETFVEELFDDQATTPDSGGGGGEGMFSQSLPGGLDDGQSRRVQ